MIRSLIRFGVLWTFVSTVWAAEPDPAKWTKAIEAFETADAKQAPPANGIVFTGSSSLALWKDMATYFPDRRVLNRAFGGSQLPEVNHFVDRIVTPYKPRIVVLFCGTNDLHAGRAPEQVRDDFRTFVSKVHGALPKTKIIYISIHLAPGRLKHADRIRKTNQMINDECAKDNKLAFLDLVDEMLGKDGKPNPEMYVDSLHPSPKAYQIWAEKLRPLLK